MEHFSNGLAMFDGHKRTFHSIVLRRHFSPLEGHLSGHFIVSLLKGNCRVHLIVFSPLEGNYRGRLIVFSPLEGNYRGALYCVFSIGRELQRALDCVLFSPLKGNYKGHFIVFSPLEGHSSGLVFYLP